MVLFHRGVGGAQLGAGLIESDSGSQTSEKLRHAMDAARHHGCGEMMRAGDNVGDDFGFFGVGDARLEHADDCRGPITDTAEANRFTEDRRVLVKSSGPETISENDDTGSLGTVILRFDQAAEDGGKTHDVEISAADDPTSNGARLTEADHGEAHRREVAKRAQSFYAGAQVLNLGYGERRVFVLDAGGALPDRDQPVLAAVDQRLEQNSAHQRENGSVRTNAERQGENYSHRQPRSSNQRVSCNPQIAKE